MRPLAPGVAALAAAVLVGVTTDLATTGFFGLGVLIATVICPPGTTLGIGIAALGAAVASGIWDHRFGSGQHVAACLLVFAQVAVAVYLSVFRVRRSSELQRVRAVAEVAQRALLPEVPAALDGAGFAARYLSAAKEASVGGDLYEVVATPHTIRLIIGDVRGKGLPAVRLAAIVLGAFREAAATWLDQEQVAAACARSVGRAADAEDFVTALLLDIHPDGRLSLCSAGHHPPLLVTQDGAATLETSFSPPFGLGERFTSRRAEWQVGNRLLLFTDGLVEARDRAGRFFPLERHVDVLRRGTPDVALDRLTATLTRHVGGNLHDDLALLLVERLPVVAATGSGGAGSVVATTGMTAAGSAAAGSAAADGSAAGGRAGATISTVGEGPGKVDAGQAATPTARPDAP